MRLRTWLAAYVAVTVLVAVASAEQGVVRGVVTAVSSAQDDSGRTTSTVTIKGEGPWQAVLTVGPDNKAAQELVGGLKPGERVAAGWVSEGGKTWVREIKRETARAEGERREGEVTKPRAEGERREGEITKPRAEYEGREGAEREARAKAERERVYKEERARAERANAEAEARKEGGDREAAERQARAERERIYKEARARAEAERKEGEPREGYRSAAQRTTMARVVSVETGEDGARVVTFAAAEGGEEMVFTVRANQTELYNAVGNLKPDSTVRVYWRGDAGKTVLAGVAPVGDKR